MRGIVSLEELFVGRLGFGGVAFHRAGGFLKQAEGGGGRRSVASS
jgi:hypothetical protein